MVRPTSELVLGIDLGTTNSVVAVADSERARVVRDVDGAQLIPSVVSFQKGKVVVGELARELRLSDASNTIYAVKRLIGRPFHSPEVTRARGRFAFQFQEGKTGGVEVAAGGETWTLPEISAFVLRECRARAERGLNASCGKAVITVPANFNELQRSATKAAGTIAGLDVLRIINEPTAAAVAHGYTGKGNKRVAVYDLGGGTFDITILESDGEVFEVVATAGDTFLGGDDFDRVIAEALVERFSNETGIPVEMTSQTFERFRAAAEWAKCTLSSKPSADLTISDIEADGSGNKVGFSTTLRRDEMNQLLMSLVEQSAAVCENAMRLGGLVARDIDHVVLVGGSTRVPLVQEQVARLFGKAPRLEFDPDVVVALGAAIQARSLAGANPPKAVFTPPSPKQVMAKHAALRDAEARRPKQPAFAPKAALGAIKLKKRATAGQKARGAAVELVGPSGTSRDPRRPPAEDRAAVTEARAPRHDPRREVEAARSPAEPTQPTPPATKEKSAAASPGWRPPAPAQVNASRNDKSAKAAPARAPAPPPIPAAPPVAAQPPPESSEHKPSAPASGLEHQLSGVPTFALDDPLASEFTPALVDLPEKPTEAKAPSLPVTPEEVTFLSQPPPPHVTPSAEKVASIRPPPLDPAAFLGGPKQNEQDHSGRALPPSLPPSRSASLGKAPPPLPNMPVPAQTPSSQAPSTLGDVDSATPDLFADANFFTSESGSENGDGIGWSGEADEDAENLFTADPQEDFDGPKQDVVLKSLQPMLLMDVTPHSLGIETVGGYCEHVIDRNAPIPVEQTRVFTTAQDGQDSVRVTVCQGESRIFGENEELGVLELENLPSARRGEIRIEVTFMLDANGTLDVRATDAATQRVHTTQINLVGGFGSGELEAMRDRQALLMGGSEYP